MVGEMGVLADVRATDPHGNPMGFDAWIVITYSSILTRGLCTPAAQSGTAWNYLLLLTSVLQGSRVGYVRMYVL